MNKDHVVLPREEFGRTLQLLKDAYTGDVLEDLYDEVPGWHRGEFQEEWLNKTFDVLQRYGVWP